MRKLRKFKKLLIPVYIIIVYCLSGCSSPAYEGKELIDKAGKLHTELESAHIVLMDNLTGETLQEITYRFAGDVMQYMYIGYDTESGKTYCEFNNGTELDMITLPEETEWTCVSKGNEGYYGYSRASRHYFADGARLLADYDMAVSGTHIIEEKLYRTLYLEYDREKLSQYSALAELGEFSDFDMEFTFDTDGRCREFWNGYTLADGARYSYSIRINPRDSALPIERTKERTVIEIE